MAAYFDFTDSIASTTREFVNYIRASIERNFIFKSEKKICWDNTCWGLKNNFGSYKMEDFY